MESWSIEVDKDYLKFSAAHFLIFPDGTAERMHGHNYKVYAEIRAGLDQHGLVLNFKEIKPLVKHILDGLDEHMIVPGKHPVLTWRRIDGSIEIRYQDRKYLLPAADVLVLPITNTSAENLATWVGGRLREEIGARYPKVRIEALRIMVEETPGQRGVYEWAAD
jgi:6-pyruvoyltetrahydropterin/6-carboxytetrahydropterin synthase